MTSKNINYCKNKNLTVAQCALCFKKTERTVRLWQSKENIILKKDYSKKRKYSLNEEYFDDIQTESQAYILGFIYADGNIANHKVLDLVVANKDLDILEKIKLELNSESPIKNKSNNQKRLWFCSVKLVKSLNKLGLFPNKTFQISIPKLKKDLIRHFLRGFFDGDGYIGRQAVLVCASETFVNQLLDLIKNKFNINIWCKKYNNTYKIQFNKKDAVFLQWLYNNSNIYLDRKYNNYITYFNDSNIQR